MASIRKIIKSNDVPAPIGPYSQAVLIDKTLYVSGVLGIDVRTGELACGDVAAEFRKVCSNLCAILQSAESSMDNVIKTTIFLTNMDDFGRVNCVYGEFFGKNHPARSCVQVVKLPKEGARVEMEAIAITGCLQTIPQSKS